MVLMAFDIEFEQAAQVVGAVIEALRREEVDRVVEGRIYPLARRKPGLGPRHEVGRLLQLQQVRPHAGGKDDVRHLTHLSGLVAVLAVTHV